jgi:uracil phosphoribosyltransferase
MHANVWHATDKSVAKVLMSSTRNASIAGLKLRKAHADMGMYLAWAFLPELLGVEDYPMLHVQGHQISGHRLRHEKETTIIALMRGGESMAFGLNEVLPLAMFLHASSPSDIKVDHVRGQKTVILVDSVVNTGRTLIHFVQKVHELELGVRIVVVAGVVQAEAVSKGHPLTELIEQHGIHIGALRLSRNKFTGFKNTDTGHRLFRTTHMA